MANEDLIHQKVFCTVCAIEVPTERLRFRSVTCSDEHAIIRQRLLRKRVDDRECRFCHKPSTPAARRAFKRFRKWERDFPEQAFPEVWAIVSAEGVDSKDFGRAVAQAVKRDVMLELDMAELEWGSTKRRTDKDKPTPELDRVLEILAAYAKAHPTEAAEPEEV